MLLLAVTRMSQRTTAMKIKRTRRLCRSYKPRPIYLNGVSRHLVVNTPDRRRNGAATSVPSLGRPLTNLVWNFCSVPVSLPAPLISPSSPLSSHAKRKNFGMSFKDLRLLHVSLSAFWWDRSALNSGISRAENVELRCFQNISTYVSAVAVTIKDWSTWKSLFAEKRGHPWHLGGHGLCPPSLYGWYATSYASP